MSNEDMNREIENLVEMSSDVESSFEIGRKVRTINVEPKDVGFIRELVATTPAQVANVEDSLSLGALCKGVDRGNQANFSPDI